MNLPVIEIYSSIECPYAYLMTYRLRQLWPVYSGKVELAWKALSLEYINRRSYPKPLAEAEYELFQQIEPGLPWKPWSRAEWEWPSTFWPAFEALACAQAQGPGPAFRMSWALRYAYFAENRNISLRHELLAIAEQMAAEGDFDLKRFVSDWDGGRCKGQVIAECRRGWHELQLEGSATLVLPDGSRWTNPATGEIDFDEEHFVLRSYTPLEGDPLDIYRGILDKSG